MTKLSNQENAAVSLHELNKNVRCAISTLNIHEGELWPFCFLFKSLQKKQVLTVSHVASNLCKTFLHSYCPQILCVVQIIGACQNVEKAKRLIAM